MPKGQYTVQADGDTSFRSCVCFLGIFLLICVLIIVISFATLKKNGSQDTGPSDYHDSSGRSGDAGAYAGGAGRNKSTLSTSSPHTRARSTAAAATTIVSLPEEPDDPDYGVSEEHSGSYTNGSSDNSTETRNTSDTSSVKTHDARYREIPAASTPATTDSSSDTTDGVGVSTLPTFTESKTNETDSTDGVGVSTLPTFTESKTNETGTTDGVGVSTLPTFTESKTNETGTTDGVGVSTLPTFTESKTNETDTTLSPESLTTSTDPPDLRALLASVPAPVRAASEENNTCKSSECRRLSVRSLSLMSLDEKVDACKDFYDYACGGLHKDPFLLPHNYWEDVWKRIEDEARNVTEDDPISYKKFQNYLIGCEEDSANETVWTELIKEEIEHFRLADKPVNFTHLFTLLIKYDSPLFFDVQLDINTAKQFTLRVVPADMTEYAFDFPKTEVRKCERRDTSKEEDITKTYEEIIECLKNEGLDLFLSDAVKALKNLYNDTRKISEIKLSLETVVGGVNKKTLGENTANHSRILQNREYDNMTATELDVFFPLVNWTQLFSALTNKTIEGNVHVYHKEYLQQVYNELITHSDGSVQEVIEAWFVVTRHRQLLQPSPDARDPFFCSRRASSLMRGVASALYVRSFDPTYVENLEKKVFTIFREVKDQLSEELKNVSSLPNEVREKIKYAKPYTFENGSLPESEELDAELNEYDISKTDFLNNTIKLMRFHRRRSYDLVGTDPSDSIWTHFLPIFDVRAKTIYELNATAIPLGMAAQPFFHPEYPLYVQYAGLGFAIAHELAHLYDYTGIQYVDGLRKKVEDYETNIPKFSPKLSNRVFGRIISYELPENHAKHNEYFADLSGLSLAYHTYQTVRERENVASLPYLNLTTGQAFFLHAAQRFCTRVPLSEMVLDLFEDVHFPPPFRVAKIPGLDIFNKIFGCGVGGNPAFPYILQE